ncbi:MAG: 50S ribosomal protein L20 [Armatimonadetes bacterium]|nr:50S ribosomal protein L20 [Armatimonadota bacterium]
MPRVKRGVNAIKKRRTIMKLAKGYRGARHKKIKAAREAVMHALNYAYRDRRAKKREFRALWIARINAGTRLHDLSYSRFIEGLTKAGVTVNRKMLSELAIHDAAAFGEYVKLAKQNLPALAPA